MPSSDASPTPDALLEKTWTVVLTDEDLTKLEVHVAGNVFVDYDASLQDPASENEVVAKVVVRGSAAKLLDSVDVTAIEEDSGLRLHYKDQYTHVEGFVMTQIFVSKPDALRSVSSTAAQNVVLGENVVVHENRAANLHFSTHGDGHIFVGSSESSANDAFVVRSMDIATAGKGGVQFQTSSLQVVGELVVSQVGSGRVAVLADELLTANKVESAIAGDGQVFIQSSDLQAEMLATEVVGEGEVTYSTSGSCVNQKISLAGSGHVESGSIACKYSAVSIFGTGDVVLQATERLTVTILLTGSVRYVNERPKSIQTTGLVLGTSIQPAKSYVAKPYIPISPPSRVATGVILTVETARNENYPYVHVKPLIETAISLQTLSVSLPESISALVLFEVAVVGMGVFAVSVFKFQQRRIREKYQVLP
ncbi:hypothetical protein BBJ28_00008537 [Nothophytophthora sp. Chile5]|nr:hypothetical protein BBJ28_00008537 [Nothophytophthora sp. Chile5]